MYQVPEETPVAQHLKSPLLPANEHNSLQSVVPSGCQMVGLLPPEFQTPADSPLPLDVLLEHLQMCKYSDLESHDAQGTQL